MSVMRAYAMLLSLTFISGCTTTEDFSFEEMIDDLVEMTVGDDDDEAEAEAEAGSEASATEDVAAPPPDSAGPAAWLIEQGCKMTSVDVEDDGTQIWKLRCPEGRWVTLEVASSPK
jgi:hypothetical protein